jgi:uncharacterized membrane protein YfcA
MGSDANTAGTLAGHRTLALVGIGLLAGFFSALFGVGGGIVIVPLLIWLVAMDAKVATATSLATIIFTSFVGVVTHGALGNVEWGYALLVGIPAVAGLLGGLWVKDRVSSRQLTLGFAALLVAVGIWLIVKPGERSTVPSLGAADAIEVVAIGIVAGGLAGLFGVGGGILFVPALALIVGLPQVHAEATSLLAIIPVALIGSWRQHLAGMVRWRDAVTMGVASAGTAVAGALVADVTPGRTLTVLFALLVILTGIQLAVRARREAPA